MNVLYNDGTVVYPRDCLMHVIQRTHLGISMLPTLNVDPKFGPIVILQHLFGMH